MGKLQFGEVWVIFPKLKQLITYKARTKINIFWIWTGSFRLPFSKDNQSQIKQLQSFIVRKMRRKCPGEKWSQNLENQEEPGNFPHPQVAGCRWVCTFAMEPEVWGHPEKQGCGAFGKNPASWPTASHAGGPACAGRAPQPPCASVASAPGLLLTHINTAPMCSSGAKSPFPSTHFCWNCYFKSGCLKWLTVR